MKREKTSWSRKATGFPPPQWYLQRRLWIRRRLRSPLRRRRRTLEKWRTRRILTTEWPKCRWLSTFFWLSLCLRWSDSLWPESFISKNDKRRNRRQKRRKRQLWRRQWLVLISFVEVWVFIDCDTFASTTTAGVWMSLKCIVFASCTSCRTFTSESPLQSYRVCSKRYGSNWHMVIVIATSLI